MATTERDPFGPSRANRGRDIRGHVSAGPAGRPLPPVPQPEEFTPTTERSNFMPGRAVTGISGMLGGLGAGLAQQPMLLEGVMRNLRARQEQGWAADQRNVEAMNAARFQNQSAQYEASMKGYETQVDQAAAEYETRMRREDAATAHGRNLAAYETERKDKLADLAAAEARGDVEYARKLRDEINDREDRQAAELEQIKATQEGRYGGEKPRTPEHGDFLDLQYETNAMVSGGWEAVGFTDMDNPELQFVDDAGGQHRFSDPTTMYHWLQSQVNAVDPEFHGRMADTAVRSWYPLLDKWAENIGQTDTPWKGAPAAVIDVPTDLGGEDKPSPLSPADIEARTLEFLSPPPGAIEDPKLHATAQRQRQKDIGTAKTVRRDVGNIDQVLVRIDKEIAKVSELLAVAHEGGTDQPGTVTGGFIPKATPIAKMLKDGIFFRRGKSKIEIPGASFKGDASQAELIALLNRVYGQLTAKKSELSSQRADIADTYGWGGGSAAGGGIAGR